MNVSTQLALPVQLRDHASFATFEAGAQPAVVAQLRQQAAAPQGLQPAWLWGDAGSGRSHLLQAICIEAAERGHAVAYLPLAQLAGFGPGILEGHDQQQVICIDDLDEVAGEPAWALALFALYNAVRESGGWLVFSTACAPSALGSALPDLESRLNAAAVQRLHALDEAGLLRALDARAQRLGLLLPEETARWLLTRVPRHATSLFTVLDELDRAALQAQRRLTVPFVRDVLARQQRDSTPVGS
jgi:DnaA family protein